MRRFARPIFLAAPPGQTPYVNTSIYRIYSRAKTVRQMFSALRGFGLRGTGLAADDRPILYFSFLSCHTFFFAFSNRSV